MFFISLFVVPEHFPNLPERTKNFEPQKPQTLCFVSTSAQAHRILHTAFTRVPECVWSSIQLHVFYNYVHVWFFWFQKCIYDHSTIAGLNGSEKMGDFHADFETEMVLWRTIHAFQIIAQCKTSHKNRHTAYHFNHIRISYTYHAWAQAQASCPSQSRSHICRIAKCIQSGIQCILYIVDGPVTLFYTWIW